MDKSYDDSIKNFKSLIFDSFLRRKTLQGSFLNGQEFSEFVLIVCKQINETNVINYGGLSITYHNVAKENLKRIKSEITTKIKGLEIEVKQRPFKWEQFNETVSKLGDGCLIDLKSQIKQDEEFQKEYIEELSFFMEDKIYIFQIFNRDQLEALHKGILDSLLNPFVEKLNKNSNQLNLENELNEIEKKYKELGIESPQLQKILNEQFIKISQVLTNFGMKLEMRNLKNIFISYTHANENIVHKIADKLKESFSVWIDRDSGLIEII